MKIVAIIPAFNEEKRIGATLLALKSYVQEMVVIDDGSLDGTVQVALDSGAHVLKHLVNRGQGASLQTGTEYALRVLEADAIVHFDADGQMDPSEIPTLLAPIASGEVDIVIGSRFLGEAVNIPPMRKFFLKLATWFTAVISGIPVTDTHNGFRVLSRKAAKEIRISLDRMAHASEIIDLIVAKNLRYREMPVTIHYSAESRAKGQSTLSAVMTLKDFFKGRFFDDV